jgi:hypothetical protein
MAAYIASTTTRPIQPAATLRLAFTSLKTGLVVETEITPPTACLSIVASSIRTPSKNRRPASVTTNEGMCSLVIRLPWR